VVVLTTIAKDKLEKLLIRLLKSILLIKLRSYTKQMVWQ